jgi:hypothetical protein
MRNDFNGAALVHYSWTVQGLSRTFCHLSPSAIIDTIRPSDGSEGGRPQRSWTKLDEAAAQFRFRLTHDA